MKKYTWAIILHNACYAVTLISQWWTGKIEQLTRSNVLACDRSNTVGASVGSLATYKSGAPL